MVWSEQIEDLLVVDLDVGAPEEVSAVAPVIFYFFEEVMHSMKEDSRFLLVLSIPAKAIELFNDSLSSSKSAIHKEPVLNLHPVFT